MRPGETAAGKSQHQAVEREGEQRDPEDVNQDNIHRQIAADQKDAKAQSARRGDGLGGDQEKPGRPEARAAAVISRGMICGNTTRRNIGQLGAERQP